MRKSRPSTSPSLLRVGRIDSEIFFELIRPDAAVMHHSVHTSGVLRPGAAARVDRRLDTEIVDCGLDCGQQQPEVRVAFLPAGITRPP